MKEQVSTPAQLACAGTCVKREFSSLGAIMKSRCGRWTSFKGDRMLHCHLEKTRPIWKGFCYDIFLLPSASLLRKSSQTLGVEILISLETV